VKRSRPARNVRCHLLPETAKDGYVYQFIDVDADAIQWRGARREAPLPPPMSCLLRAWMPLPLLVSMVRWTRPAFVEGYACTAAGNALHVHEFEHATDANERLLISKRVRII